MMQKQIIKNQILNIFPVNLNEHGKMFKILKKI